MERKKKKNKSSPDFDLDFGPDFFLFSQIIKLSQVQELDLLGFEENGQISAQLKLSAQIRSNLVSRSI
jgi:hypothetical protein